MSAGAADFVSYRFSTSQFPERMRWGAKILPGASSTPISILYRTFRLGRSDAANYSRFV